MRNNLNRVVWAFIFGSIFIASLAQAGVVVLKSGEKITGIITKKTKKYIEINTNGEIKTYKLKNIAQIRGNKPVIVREAVINNDIDLNLKNALENAANGFFLTAEENFKKILELNSSYANAEQALNIIADLRHGQIENEFAIFLFKGAYFSLNKEYEKSIIAYKKALKINPDSGEVYYNLGSAYQALEEFQKALPYFEKLSQTNPFDTDVLFKLGFSYHRLGQYHKSIAYLEKIIDDFSDDPEIYGLLGIDYYSIGEYGKAKDFLAKARDIYMDNQAPQRAKVVEDILETIP